MEDQNITNEVESTEPTLKNTCPSCIEHENKWKRAMADYDNLRKQVARENAERFQYASFRAAEVFLTPLTHLQVALKQVPTAENWKSWIQGIALIERQFAESVAELGIQRMLVLGKPFNPAEHESVGSREEIGAEAGTIIEEREAGYLMNGKVLRPARVIVAEALKENSPEETGSESKSKQS